MSKDTGLIILVEWRILDVMGVRGFWSFRFVDIKIEEEEKNLLLKDF